MTMLRKQSVICTPFSTALSWKELFEYSNVWNLFIELQRFTRFSEKHFQLVKLITSLLIWV